MKHKHLIRNCLLAALAVALLAGGSIYYLFFSPTFSLNETTYLYIRPGDTLENVCHQLEEKANPKTLTGFRWLASFYGYDGHIRSGRYAVKPEDTVFGLIRRLSTGQQTPVNLIIPSVRTTDKLAAAVADRIMLDSATVASALADSTVCARLGYTTQTIACLFIPNTYQVYWDMDLDGFLSRMEKEHKRFWNEDAGKSGAIGLTPEEVMTLACHRGMRRLQRTTRNRWWQDST